MFSPVLARLLGIVFAAIQTLLTFRLALAFVDVPDGVRQYVPLLRSVTDLLTAPFRGVTSIAGISLDSFTGSESFIGAGVLDKLDPAVVVAMIGWSIIGLVVVLAVRIFGKAINI